MQRDICVFILNSVLSSPEQSWSHQGRFAFWTWGRFAWGLRISSGTSHTDHWTHQPVERSLTRHEWLHNLYYGISDEAKQFQGNWSLEDCNFTKFTWLPLVHSAGLIWPAKSSQHLKIIIWQNGYVDFKSLKIQKTAPPNKCSQKGRLDQTNTNLVSIVWATLGGYSWSLTATAARLSPRTNTWHIYSASLTCKTIPCSAGLNILYATYRLTGSYCCSLHKNLASECDEVLGSAALEEAYAGQVEPALKIILDLEIQSSLRCLIWAVEGQFSTY